jgi:hypothetical protein
MGPRVPAGTRLWLGGLAAGGVAAAHVLAFLLVAPDPAQRAAMLEATGHGAWPLAVTLCMGALVAGLAGFAVGRLREDETRPRDLYRGTLGRLLGLQILGFVLLEALERVARHELSAVLGLLGEPVVLIGLVLAAVTAAVGAALIVLFAGLIDRLVVRVRALPRAPRALVPTGLAILCPPRLRIVLGSVSPRGPPQPAR